MHRIESGMIDLKKKIESEKLQYFNSMLPSVSTLIIIIIIMTRNRT
jgi:hypothetical protein